MDSDNLAASGAHLARWSLVPSDDEDWVNLQVTRMYISYEELMRARLSNPMAVDPMAVAPGL